MAAGGRVHGLGDDGAHAHDRRGDGDEPEPAAVRARDHLDVARAASLVAGNAFELRVHGDVAQHGIDHALAEALGQEPGAAGRVHHRAHAHGVREALGVDVVEGRALVVEDRVQGARALQDLGSAALGVPEQHVVEALARHLVGLRGLCLHRAREVGVLGRAAVVRREARAPLVDEARLQDEVLAAERAEDLVAPGELALADVEARERLALQEQHTVTLACELRRRGGAARPSADHRHLVVPASRHVNGLPGW